MHPLLRAGNADREILQPRQREVVNGENRIERYLTFQAGLGILGDELDAGATGIEREDRVGLCGARLRQLGGEIGLGWPTRQLLADERGLYGLLVHVDPDRLRRLVIIP